MKTRTVCTLIWVLSVAALLAAPSVAPASDLPTSRQEPAYIGNDPEVPDYKLPARAHAVRQSGTIDTDRPSLEAPVARPAARIEPASRTESVLLRIVRALSLARWGGLLR
jgi:hypothetical protein